MMDVGDPAGQRVLDRDHRQISLARAHRVEGVVEGGARERRVVGMDRLAGHVRIGARLALEGDLHAASTGI